MTGILVVSTANKMRGFLFNLVATVGAHLITVISWISALMTSTVGNIGAFLMRAIDSQRLDVYETLLRASQEPSELDQQNMELRLLASAAQVRDHAKETDDWTDRHTEAINAIGEALITEAGWHIDHVDRYLKELVESIDGLEYGTEEF